MTLDVLCECLDFTRESEPVRAMLKCEMKRVVKFGKMQVAVAVGGVM